MPNEFPSDQGIVTFTTYRYRCDLGYPRSEIREDKRREMGDLEGLTAAWACQNRRFADASCGLLRLWGALDLLPGLFRSRRRFAGDSPGPLGFVVLLIRQVRVNCRVGRVVS